MIMAKKTTTDKLRRPKSIEVGKHSHTEDLAEWISKVRHKKLKCYRSPKRDFRVEAVLTYTLHKAQYELRSKQLARMARWQRLKKDLLKGVEYGSCATYHAIEAERQKQQTMENRTQHNKMCEELNSLDDFLNQLSEIKSFVQLSPFEMATDAEEKKGRRGDKGRERGKKRETESYRDAGVGEMCLKICLRTLWPLPCLPVHRFVWHIHILKNTSYYCKRALSAVNENVDIVVGLESVPRILWQETERCDIGEQKR